jgi:hypothetical protein
MWIGSYHDGVIPPAGGRKFKRTKIKVVKPKKPPQNKDNNKKK